MDKYFKYPTIILFAFILFGSCSKNDDSNTITSVPPPPVNQTLIGKYILNGEQVNCKCYTDNMGYVFLQDEQNNRNSFSIDKMPAQSSGTYNLGKNFTGNTSLPMGYLLESRAMYSGYGSETGTVTKTGARTFTFQCILYNPLTTTKFTITGNGKY